jgi:Kef-type K+ transport system membrane component KefB
MSARFRSVCISILALTPVLAHAADLEGTLRNLVTAVTGRLLPILALGYLAKNIFAHIQSDPNAKQETFRVVIAIVCLLGLSSVWSFLSQQVR